MAIGRKLAEAPSLTLAHMDCLRSGAAAVGDFQRLVFWLTYSEFGHGETQRLRTAAAVGAVSTAAHLFQHLLRVRYVWLRCHDDQRCTDFDLQPVRAGRSEE